MGRCEVLVRVISANVNHSPRQTAAWARAKAAVWRRSWWT